MGGAWLQVSIQPARLVLPQTDGSTPAPGPSAGLGQAAAAELATSAGPLTTSNGRIVDSTGTEFYFTGINWFGFDSEETMVDGEPLRLFEFTLLSGVAWAAAFCSAAR